MVKNIIISEKQARKLKKAIAAQYQVGGKVNAGIMDAVCGAVCESSNSNNIEIWYRGYNGKYGINGENSNVLWLTTDASYAKSYGNRVKEYKLDMSKCNIGSVFDIDDLCGYDFDYYDGPDDELINTALENGIDGYWFEANYDNSECMCLWSNKPIISERDLTKEEYDAIDEYDNFDYQPYMALNESVDWADICEEHTVEDLLNEFERDKERGITQKQWRLIPAEQYHTLLKRYMENPQMAKIPYNIVYDWFNNIIIPNAVDIEYITQLAGHSQWGPWDEVADYFGEDIGNFEDCSEYLENIGFYDWCLFPDGSSAWSDYGLEPLFKIINEFQDNSTAEDILILINRCLDVAHCRGDLSSAFIEGGKHSCDKISNSLNETAPDYEIAFEGDNNTYAHLTNRKSLNENSNDRKVNDYVKEKFGITDFQDIRNKVMEIYEKIPYARIDGGRHMIGVMRLLFDENLPKEDYGVLNKILYKIGRSGYNEIREVNDGNLGGLSFEELKEKYFVPDFEGATFSTAEKQVKVANGYTVTRIDTYDEMNAMCEGEWCIANDEHMWYELLDYETVYLVENEQLINKFDEYYATHSKEWNDLAYAAGEEDDMMEMGFLNSDLSWTNKPGSWKFPYDYYGLSRFVVLVGEKYITVYSRYNMPNDFDGDYLTKGQIEKLLGINFTDVFKYVPRNNDECLNETAPDYEIAFEGDNSTYSHLTNRKTLNESVEWNEAFNYKPYIISITEFLMDEGMKITPLPVVRLHREEQEGLYIKTGYYDPEHREINLFVKDRHPKDVLRSFVHEMIHHNQNITGVIASNGYKGNTLEGDTELEKLEDDAYLRGNIYFRRWTESIRPDFKSKDVQNLIAEDTIDLSSFVPHAELNPKFWKDEKLDSRVRLKLLDIADDFIDFLDVDWVEPVDIIMTGSLANYNWSEEHSDVDLHIVMNFKDVDENEDFVKEFFDAKKKLWNDTHEGLTIYRYPVELYVQDACEKHSSSGVYSLEKNEWIVKPDADNFSMDDFDNDLVTDKAERYTELTDTLCDAYKKGVLEPSKIYDYASKLFKLIKNERQKGFEKSDNEYNDGNIIFKSLRRNGCIEKLAKLKILSYDKANSLNENKNILTENQKKGEISKYLD